MNSRRDFIAGTLMLTSGHLPTPLATGPDTASASGSGFFPVKAFGALADGKTADTAALQKTIDSCAAAGGGTVYIAPGTYLSSPIQLKSNVTLHLEAGARILGSPRLDDYEVEGTDSTGEPMRTGLLTTRGAENVSIVGRGVIDGNALVFHDSNRLHSAPDFDPQYTRQKQAYGDPKFGTQDGPIAHGQRPGNLIRFFNCKNVVVTGVTICESPTWTMEINRCEHVVVQGVHIHSLGSGRRVPNDDGMDLAGCNNVHVSDCTIETGDDCIAVFGSRNVHVTNCTLRTRSAGIRVSYDEGISRDCTFSNLTIDGNRGLLLNVRGDNSIENVSYSNIVIRTSLFTGHWWGKAEPIHVSAIPFKGSRLGTIRNVSFSGITANSESGILLHGSPQSVLEGISLHDVRLRIRNGPLQAAYGGNFDLRTSADVSHGLFAHDISGLDFRHVRNLDIEDFQLEWSEDYPEFFTHGICGEDFERVSLRRFRGCPAKAASAIRLARGTDIQIEGCCLTREAPVFVELSQVSRRRLFAHNDVELARRVASPSLDGFLQVGNLMPRPMRH